MPQRVVSLGLVLCGVLLGALLPRPWLGAGEVEAKGGTDIRCVGYRFPGGAGLAMVTIHNPGAAAASGTVDFQNDQGVSLLESSFTGLPPGESGAFSAANPSVVLGRITSSAKRLIVDGEMIYDDAGSDRAYRQVTCATAGKA